MSESRLGKELVSVSEHCWLVSKLLEELWIDDPTAVTSDPDPLDFSDASRWLQMAAGTVSVRVDTARFDDSIVYCGLAADFEDARSDLFSRLATEITKFLFAWGALETTVKIVNPPSIPPGERSNGANGTLDRALFLLRSYLPRPEHLVAFRQLASEIQKSESFSQSLMRNSRASHIGPGGEGLDLVRRLRNKFAHGDLNMPIPNNDRQGQWSGKVSFDPSVVETSSRIVLFFIQMLLETHYRGRELDVHILVDEDGLTVPESVHNTLKELHWKTIES
jgi:hypothetical protein